VPQRGRVGPWRLWRTGRCGALLRPSRRVPEPRAGRPAGCLPAGTPPALAPANERLQRRDPAPDVAPPVTALGTLSTVPVSMDGAVRALHPALGTKGRAVVGIADCGNGAGLARRLLSPYLRSQEGRKRTWYPST